MPIHYEVRVAAWIMGGELPAGPVVLTTYGSESIGITPVGPRDVAIWRDPPGPPIRSDQLALIGIGCEVTSGADLPDVRPDRPVPYGLDLLALYGPLRLGELSYLAIQAADMVRLIIHPELQIAFIDTEVRLGSSSITAPSFVEYRPGLGQQRWAISAAQAAQLPTQWTSITSGPNSSRVRMPLRRWGASMQRRFDEDKVLDCWIGLEGLFTAASHDVAASITPQIAQLLGLNRAQQGNLQTDLTSSYRVRNKVVHGDVYTEPEVQQAVAASNATLRSSLLALL